MEYRRQRDKSAIDRLLQRFGRSKIGGKLFITVFPEIDKRLIPLTRGRLKIAMGQPICLVHTRGAKSGQPRSTPLLYTPRGDAMVLVASKAGAERNPAWYHNLKANPDVDVDVGGRRRPMHAREVEGAERDELWALVNDNYDGYDTYQHRAGGRRIPVLVLEPR